MKSKRCAVIKCKNDDTSSNVSFHGLPADSLDACKWNEFLDLANQDFVWTKTASMLICSEHFDTTCYGLSANRLLKHSIPTKVQGKSIQIQRRSAVKPSCFQTKEQRVMLSLSNANEWSDKVAEYGIALSLCEEEVLKLKRRVRELEEVADQKQKKIHVLTQQSRRQQKRKTEELPSTSAKKPKIIKTIDSSTQTSFLSLEPISPAEVILKEISDRLIDPHSPYSDTLKNFSFELHYKSPAAYSHLREKLEKALPHPINFNRWTKHIVADPGFIASSFDYLKEAVEKADHVKYVAFMFDELYMRKQLLHDGDGFLGFVDYGELGEPIDPTEVATKALFFNLTEINGTKKVPVAYALTNKLPHQSLRQMLERVLIRLHMIGVRVLTMTCDGLGANLAAIESMGANLKPLSPGFQPWITHPVTGDQIYIILDACHMYKLIRNVFKAKSNLYIREDGTAFNSSVVARYEDASLESNNESACLRNENMKVISWRYIEKLQVLQRECGLRAANKLTTRHVSFETQKMKTKLCLQTLSNSVSVAIGVCRDLKIGGFEGSEETQYFLALMNRLFDVLNSRSSGKGTSAPLRQSNNEIWQPLFNECKHYLLNLHYDEKNDGKLIPLMISRKATAFKGLFITITSLELIMTNIIFDPNIDLWYLPTWKFLQDAIELFFALLRSRFGYNDNPNVKQLKYAVRDIMCMKLKDLLTGNCIAQEDLSSAISPLKNLRKIVYDDDSDSCDVGEVVIPQLNLPNDSIVFIRVIVVYIAGYTISKLCRSLKCPSCICMLLAEEVDLDEQYLLVMRRDFGGLCYPNKEVIKICTILETHVRFWNSKGLQNMKKRKVIESSLRECQTRGLTDAMKCEEGDTDHGVEFVRNIMNIYLEARLHHLARESTATVVPTTNRNSNKKGTHFAGN